MKTEKPHLVIYTFDRAGRVTEQKVFADTSGYRKTDPRIFYTPYNETPTKGSAMNVWLKKKIVFAVFTTLTAAMIANAIRLEQAMEGVIDDYYETKNKTD